MLVQELKSRAPRFIGSSVGICLILYFVYHLIQGERGILSWVRLDQEVTHIQKNLKNLEDMHQRLENRVHHLRDSSLSLELLEEEAKKQGFIHPQEVVVKTLPRSPSSPTS